MKVALALLAVVVLVSGCISGSHVAYRETGHNEPVITVSDISTDKGIYHSGEQMMISAILHSDMDAAE